MSFTFTMDAFPDYTRFNKTKKVLAAIQIVDSNSADNQKTRERTKTGYDIQNGDIIGPTYSVG